MSEQYALPPVPSAIIDAPQPRRLLVAGVDLAFAHDGCALVVLEHSDDSVRVIDHDFRVPRPGEPFDPVETADEYLRRIASLGCSVVVADVHYVEVVRRAAREHGVALVSAPAGEERIRAFVLARHYTRSRAIRFPRLIAEHLRKIQLVVRPGGGVSVQAPRTDGGGHADLAFALVAAVAIDARMHGLVGDAQMSVRAHRGAWMSP